MSHLSDLLHERQMSLGLSVADLQSRTKIREKYIVAILRGEYAVIPGEVYLRGFVRSIASELGIDPGEAMQAYYQDLHSDVNSHPDAAHLHQDVSSHQDAAGSRQDAHSRQDAASAQATVPPVAPVTPRPAADASANRQPATERRTTSKTPVRPPQKREEVERSTRSRSTARRRRKSLKRGPLLLLVALLLVAVGVWYWATELRQPTAQPPVDEPPVVTDPNPTEPTEPILTVTLVNPGEKNPSYLVKPGPLTVSLIPDHGRCWVGNATVDGVGRESEMLDFSGATGNKELELTANEQIKIRVGYPSVLRLVINGQDQGIMGGDTPRDLTISVDTTP